VRRSRLGDCSFAASAPGPTFVTDGGLETTLIFHDGVDLPEFAAFVLLDRPGGTDALRRYYSAYVDIAREQSVGIVLDTPTWRANPDWCERLGYSLDALADVNRARSRSSRRFARAPICRS